MNEIDLRKATHDEAIGVLRLTTQRVHLRVFRHQEDYREEDLWDVFSMELRPLPGEGLGVTTVGKWYVKYSDNEIRILKMWLCYLIISSVCMFLFGTRNYNIHSLCS